MKVLIVSNDCFSESSSNGRTLMYLLGNFPPSSLAQFYLHGEPDHAVCAHYFCVSDREALNALIPFRKRKVTGAVLPNQKEEPAKKTSSNPNKVKRNCRNLFIRDLVWRSNRWKGKELDRFIEEFDPDMVLLQAGDSPFMFDIARKIAKKRDIPLCMFNTENYVLKKVLYSGVSRNSVWHYLLQRTLRREYAKFMQQADFCFYSTEYLEKEYQLKYPHAQKSHTFYVATQMSDCAKLMPDPKRFSLLYCGNLGVGRIDALEDIARVLYEVDITAQLQIYGRFINESDEKRLCGMPNVVYGGVIPYERVPYAIANSSMIIHCENSTRLENLKGAFSTKIADCLACGKPFLVYADKAFPFVEYLEQHKAAHLVSNEAALKSCLGKCINNVTYRNQYVANALALAAKNHNAERNSENFYSLMESAIDDYQQNQTK